MSDLLTAADVAEIMGVCVNTAREIIRSLPHIKIGGRYRVRRETLESYIIKKERASR